jgi:hypothetical protein
VNGFRISSVSRLAALILAASPAIIQAQNKSVEERLKALEEQNALLKEQVSEQQKTIQDLKEQIGPTRESSPESTPASNSAGFNMGNVHISAEGGAGYFKGGSDAIFPEGAFRVDEAKLFVEAPLWQDTYFFSELNLVIRESDDEFLHLGEIYIDFENLSRFWSEKNYLNLRAGRIDIPFGEEYLSRDSIDNPLISHSLSDIWGVDEGLELYGSLGHFDYVLALQNGGNPTLDDYDSDKAVVGRVGYNFGNRARLSVSGMRTGALNTAGDGLSESWFGNGFFAPVGDPDATPTFEANLFELDGQTHWKTGHLKLAGGYFQYDDTNPSIEKRDGYYYYAEALQHLNRKLYAAARFSQILSEDGIHLVGFGNFGKYLFTPLITKDLWRLSLGLGYQWSESLVTKLEYSFERGELVGGGDRDHEDFLGAEISFKF